MSPHGPGSSYSATSVAVQGRVLEYRRPSICGQECLCDHLPRRLTELASLPLKQGLECFPR